MYGLAADNSALWDTLPEKEYIGDCLAVNADFFQNQAFIKKYSKADIAKLFVRHAVSPRLNRLILESETKLQNDYLDSFVRQMRFFHTFGVKKIQMDFDLPSVFKDEELTAALLNILRTIKGITYDYGIETELLFRLPQSTMENFTAEAAFFRQQSLLGMNYALDIHFHEAGFDREEICSSILPVEYDISCINFVYDAALGNKINPNTLSKIINFMKDKGAECDFLLYPSGNINYQVIRQDVEQWFNIFEQKEVNDELRS